MKLQFQNKDGGYFADKILEPDIDLSDIDALQSPVLDMDKIVLDDITTPIIQSLYNASSFSFQSAVQIVKHCLGRDGNKHKPAYQLLIQVYKSGGVEWKDFWDAQLGKFGILHGTGRAKLVKLYEPESEYGYLACTFKYNPDILIHGW